MGGRATTRRGSRSAVSVAAAAALLVAACSSGASGTPGTTGPAGTLAPSSASNPAPATSTPRATLAPLPTPLFTNAAGVRTCVSSSEGPEVSCALHAGTYATDYFEPALTYTVPSAGWTSLNRAASPGNLHLFPPGGALERFATGDTDDITVLTAVVAPGPCSGEPSTAFAGTFDGLLEFLTTDPHVSIHNLRDASVGGLQGKALDIAFVASDGCDDGDYADILVGVPPSHGAFGMAPTMAGTRLYLLHRPGQQEAFALLIDDARGGGSDYGDGEAWYAPAQTVVDSLVISG